MIYSFIPRTMYRSRVSASAALHAACPGVPTSEYVFAEIRSAIRAPMGEGFHARRVSGDGSGVVQLYDCWAMFRVCAHSKTFRYEAQCRVSDDGMRWRWWHRAFESPSLRFTSFSGGGDDAIVRFLDTGKLVRWRLGIEFRDQSFSSPCTNHDPILPTACIGDESPEPDAVDDALRFNRALVEIERLFCGLFLPGQY